MNRYGKAELEDVLSIEQAYGRKAAMRVWSDRRDLRGQPFDAAFAAVFHEMPSKTMVRGQRVKAEAAARAEWERLLENWRS